MHKLFALCRIVLSTFCQTGLHMPLDPNTTTDVSRATLPVVRDTCIVATLVVLGLYAGAAFLIPLTMALLVNVLIIALSDRIAALTRVPVWLANIAGVTVAR